MAEKSDFDYSDRSLNDPNIKVPGAAHGAESLEEEQAAEADAGNDRDLADKSPRQAQEINFATGNLEPVADHLTDAPDPDAPKVEHIDATMSPKAKGPADPHAGNAEQSAVDDPKAKAKK